ncbi:hypothetical protein N9937_01945 [bacterium]|nr:hypothetical protein [bacterium]
MSNFIYEHGLASVFALLWGMCLFTWVTWTVFTNPVDIPTNTMMAFTTMYGLPAVVIGFFKWRNSKGEDKNG